MTCMHPGMTDQTDNALSVEGEWNLSKTEQSDDEDEESDNGDRCKNSNVNISHFYIMIVSRREIQESSQFIFPQ